MNQATVSSNQQHSAVKVRRNLCYESETLTVKESHVYDVLFRARKLITMKGAKCHLRKNGVLLRKTSEEMSLYGRQIVKLAFESQEN